MISLVALLAGSAWAQGGKAPIARLADTVSGIFTPAVLIIALLTLVAWLLAAPPETRLSAARLWPPHRR